MMTNKLLYTVYDCRASGLTTCYIGSVLMLHKSWQYPKITLNRVILVTLYNILLYKNYTIGNSCT
jgi:hypothetical protein